MNYTTKKLVIAALMTAFTCIATMVIKISTPTYIWATEWFFYPASF